MFLTTETYLNDYEITERLGIVYGISVYSRSVIGNFLGNISAFFGEEQTGYTKMVMENRNKAVERMISQAENAGADAVIGLYFDSNEFDAGQKQSMNEIVAYGTAVKLKKR